MFRRIKCVFPWKTKIEKENSENAAILFPKDFDGGEAKMEREEKINKQHRTKIISFNNFIALIIV